MIIVPCHLFIVPLRSIVAQPRLVFGDQDTETTEIGASSDDFSRNLLGHGEKVGGSPLTSHAILHVLCSLKHGGFIFRICLCPNIADQISLVALHERADRQAAARIGVFVGTVDPRYSWRFRDHAGQDLRRSCGGGNGSLSCLCSRLLLILHIADILRSIRNAARLEWTCKAIPVCTVYSNRLLQQASVF